MPLDIRLGHVIDVLRELPADSVDCCVTSPPFWGLRNYGVPDQIWGGDPAHEHVWGDQIPGSNRGGSGTPNGRNGAGENYGKDAERGTFCECGAWRGSLGLEPTPQLFVEHIVMVFREIRRVLRPEGTCWLNLGDSYATGAGKVGNCPGGGMQGENWEGPRTQPNRMKIPGLKPKDLVGIPWRCAFALQDDGWWLRSDIIWAKPAPMPESVTDRPTRSHEYIFLLAKSERYYYDYEAIKEPCVANHGSGNGYKRDPRLTHADKNGARGSDEPWINNSKRLQEADRIHGNIPGRDDAGRACNKPDQTTRNKRDVWTINTQSTPEAHFATYPIALAETCILAGCPVDGLVLDPFSGAGTTGLAAIKHGRNYRGIELNPAYVKISADRVDKHAPLLALSI